MNEKQKPVFDGTQPVTGGAKFACAIVVVLIFLFVVLPLIAVATFARYVPWH